MKVMRRCSRGKRVRIMTASWSNEPAARWQWEQWDNGSWVATPVYKQCNYRTCRGKVCGKMLTGPQKGQSLPPDSGCSTGLCVFHVMVVWNKWRHKSGRTHLPSGSKKFAYMKVAGNV